MRSENYLILIFLILPLKARSQIDVENSELEIGEICTLAYNKFGICKEVMDCEPVKQLFDQERYTEIIRCGFVGQVPIVCCSTESESTESLQPTNIVYSRKFLEALCIEESSEVIGSHYIKNGEKAEIGELPFQVSLGYRNLEDTIEFNCGGSLIADDYVLTAAHCANKKDKAPFMVRLGRTSLDLNDENDNSIAQDIEIEKITIHEHYTRLIRQNDIALIKLKKPVTFSHTVQKICISTKSDTANRKFTISGFGVIDTDTGKRSDWLLKGIVYEVPLDECQQKFESISNRYKISDNQLCAVGNNDQDGCQGDSGGPLVYYENTQPQLIGIISYGDICGGHFPAVYTKVNKFFDFINEQMLLLG